MFCVNNERPYNYRNLKYTKKAVVFNGDYLSEKWFETYKEKVVQKLEPPKELKDFLIQKYSSILSHPLKVGINIRTFLPDIILQRDQTGYIKRLFAYIPTKDYLINAIKKFPSNALFIVTSDNIAWSKKVLKEVNRSFVFINCLKKECKTKYTNNTTTLEDFYLMTMCDHMIITSSTFGWWAAYLIKNPKKMIIAPEPFYQIPERNREEDCPSSWIRLPRQ